MNDPKRPRYWMCIIGPVPDDQLPFGADYAPRIAARNAVFKATGIDPDCLSGWIEEAELERIQKAEYDL